MLKNALRSLEAHKTLVQVSAVALFFAVYLLIGLSVYRDYGISDDEGPSFDRGQLNYQRFTGAISQADFYKSCRDSLCFYPPLFEIAMYGFAHTGSWQTIYQTRHLVTFLYFVLAVFFFFLLAKTVLKNWKLGLLGALFLILTPRLFAQSFYNPKDIPFLSSYVIAMFTMIMYLRKKNISSAILHGIATGAACNIRTPGNVLVLITFGFLAVDLLFSKASWKDIQKAVLPFCVFVIVTGGVVYATFPSIYEDPIGNYIKTFNIMKQFPWNGYQLYLGENISNQIPWHYSIVWFGVTTPLLYAALFLLGLALLLIKFIRNYREEIRSNLDIYVVAACGILPIIIVILMKSVLYTDNRQMLFCYPALLLVGVYAFSWLVQTIRRKIKHPALRQGIILAILILGLSEPVSFLLAYHPYEYTYFNILAGTKMSVVKERFQLDTWKLSLKQAFEYLLKTDPRPNITIANIYYINPSGRLIIGTPSQDRAKILSDADVSRLVFTIDDPEYVIYNFQAYPTRQPALPASMIVYSIQVGDTDIMQIYRRH